MNGKIANGPIRITRRAGAGSRSQVRATTPLRPVWEVRLSSDCATHSSVPTRDLSTPSTGSGIAAGRSPSSRGGPPPSELNLDLLNDGRPEQARRSDEEHDEQEREDVEVCVDRPARKVAGRESFREADQEAAHHGAGDAPDSTNDGCGESLQAGGEAHQREDLPEDEAEHDAARCREGRSEEEGERDHAVDADPHHLG